MSKFLRTIMWRPAHHGKHKKLSEEMLNHNAPHDKKSGKRESLEEDFGCDGYEEDEIASFQVKYVGSTVVEKLSGDAHISEHAVQCILSDLKAQKTRKAPKAPALAQPDAKAAKKRKKPSRNVELTISPKGLCVMQADQGVDLLKISIYRISNCRTHRQHIVSFLATDALETTECHAFLCKGRKTAENVALAMARAFHHAYEQWTNVANIMPLRLEELRGASTLPPPVPARAAQLIVDDADVRNEIADLLITFDDEHDHEDSYFASDKEIAPDCSFGGNAWVSFEDAPGVDLLC